MRPLHIYVETSVLGFLFEDTEVNRTKRETTEKMFEQIREQRLIAHVSGLVFAELEDTPNTSSRDALLGIARELHRLPEPDSAEVDALVDSYMAKKAFPEDQA